MELANHHSISELGQILSSTDHVFLSKEACARVEGCHAYLQNAVATRTEPIYGINTGFGSLYNRKIEQTDLQQLQVNLLRSHAVGLGQEVPSEIVRIMLLLKARSLALGHSGVQLKTIQKLLDLYNANYLPIVYELGSLGASGDLAPLAHLCLPLIGEGEIRVDGHRAKASEYLEERVTLGPKEGLALINGTQFMQAYGLHCILRARNVLNWADRLAALSLEAYDGRIEPFLAYSHRIRPHKGQQETAKRISEILDGSEIIRQTKSHVQDPYSFRCVPQVHGASRDALAHVEAVFEIELNSVTDNPNVFPEEDLILSAGNFHGQPLALQLDFLAIAMAEIGSISERRTYRLLEGKRGLPHFLTEKAGLQSGLMIAQYTAASIVSQNKQLCTPASVDTIESSNGQEDHVSMGANAATKCLRVIENVERILAIELLSAAKGVMYRRPLRSSEHLEELISMAHQAAHLNDEDRPWSDEINTLLKLIR